MKEIETVETFNFNIYRKKRTFDHSVIIVRRISDNKLIFSGRVNWQKFKISMNGQVFCGKVKTNNADRKIITNIIAETEKGDR